MLNAYRIVKTRYAKDFPVGEGAFRNGGRWTSPGQRVLYASESLPLAVLEVLVHLGHPAVLPAYSFFTAEFSENLVEPLDPSTLPENWRRFPAPAELQAIGDGWIAALRTPILKVPSAVLQPHSNYVLHPAHRGFSKIEISGPHPLDVDPRIFESRTA